MKFLKIILILTCLSAGRAFGDDPEDIPADTIALEAIEITANRLVNFTTGAKIQRISLEIKNDYNNSNLSDLFAQITPISVKSYGMAGLSNVSLRGMHSKHTAIIWNGINLQSSMNGGFDMNSIPTFIIDEIDIQYGGSGALFGSGAVGGIIHLNNSLKLDNKFEVQLNQNSGSFSNYFEGLKINYSNTNFASTTRIYHKYGKNDFSFINSQQFGKPKVKQENSASTQYGILQSNLSKINSKQRISTNIWAQHHYLEIPGMVTTNNAEANQNADILRLSAMWNINGEISSWYSRFYYNYESLVYNDPLISLISEMDNYSIVGEIENKTSISNNFLLNVGINNTFQKAITKNYGDDKKRNRIALFTSLKYFNTSNTFATVLSFIEEFIDNDFAPFTFSISSRYYIHKSININTNISKTYNLTTFNDLYWLPGGNTDLKSEDGWSEDLGLNFDYSFLKNKLSIGLSAFNINLNNHVIWIATSGSNWSAENVEKLWSRGLESNLNYSYKTDNFSIGLNLMYTFTKSTYEKSENTEESSVGKQLMYIPLHKGHAGFNTSFKWVNLNYYHNFEGTRY
ncbi:MAG: TonB-dependent receptor plug domain-containing protein, partial [Bacteroidales bacterium]|nr:TonB-dependent receptor plug domain-containing protein [Bacteroidales bacterium]